MQLSMVFLKWMHIMFVLCWMVIDASCLIEWFTVTLISFLIFKMLQQIQENYQSVLCESLEEICLQKQFQEKCLWILVHALQSYEESLMESKKSEVETDNLFSRYQLMVSSVLLTTLPRHFPGVSFWTPYISSKHYYTYL